MKASDLRAAGATYWPPRLHKPPRKDGTPDPGDAGHWIPLLGAYALAGLILLPPADLVGWVWGNWIKKWAKRA